MAVLTSTDNLCFEQKYEKYQIFLSENFQIFEVKFSVYLNRRVFVMGSNEYPGKATVRREAQSSQSTQRSSDEEQTIL